MMKGLSGGSHSTDSQFRRERPCRVLTGTQSLIVKADRPGTCCSPAQKRGQLWHGQVLRVWILVLLIWKAPLWRSVEMQGRQLDQ